MDHQELSLGGIGNAGELRTLDDGEAQGLIKNCQVVAVTDGADIPVLIMDEITLGRTDHLGKNPLRCFGGIMQDDSRTEHQIKTVVLEGKLRRVRFGQGGKIQFPCLQELRMTEVDAEEPDPGFLPQVEQLLSVSTPDLQDGLGRQAGDFRS